jgi:hypothetical protein
MPERVTPPPYRQKDEQQGLYILPIPKFSPRARLCFGPSDLVNTQEDGNITRSNPFTGNAGETVRTDSPQKRLEDPEEGWTFQGKKKEKKWYAR